MHRKKGVHTFHSLWSTHSNNPDTPGPWLDREIDFQALERPDPNSYGSQIRRARMTLTTLISDPYRLRCPLHFISSNYRIRSRQVPPLGAQKTPLFLPVLPIRPSPRPPRHAGHARRRSQIYINCVDLSFQIHCIEKDSMTIFLSLCQLAPYDQSKM